MLNLTSILFFFLFRLKDFISKKKEKEREALERKRLRFQELQHTPKHIFQDETYYEQKELREKNLHDSIDKGNFLHQNF